MTEIEKFLKEVKERADQLDDVICEVAQNPKAFRMSIPPQKCDTDILATDLCRTEIPKLVKMVDYLIRANCYCENESAGVLCQSCDAVNQIAKEKP